MDKEKVVSKMNAALERELHEVVRYMHQSFWVRGPRAARLRAFFREQSRESMGHATTLGEQIVALGGRPVVKILEIYEPDARGEAELLEECVRHEEAACEGYKKMLPLVEGDPRLKRVIASLAREEGEHIDAIRRMAKRSRVAVFEAMREDLRSVMERDPAATSRLQVALLYSGLHAIWAHRLAHGLNRRGFRFLARAVSQAARFLTGVEIHPASSIGRRFFIDHGTGVIIGETAVVGDDVLLYQGVTLGGTGKETGKRHPTVGDRVVVGAGAKILGNIRIGSDTRVGANSVVLRDVPPHSTVVGIPGRVVRRRKGDENEVLSHQNLPDPTMEALARLAARVESLERKGGARKAPARKR